MFKWIINLFLRKKENTDPLSKGGLETYTVQRGDQAVVFTRDTPLSTAMDTINAMNKADDQRQLSQLIKEELRKEDYGHKWDRLNRRCYLCGETDRDILYKPRLCPKQTKFDVNYLLSLSIINPDLYLQV